MVRIREQVSLNFASAIAGEPIKEDIVVVSGTMPKVLADVESRNWPQALLPEEDDEEEDFLEEQLPNLRILGISSKLIARSCSRLVV